MTGLQAHGDWGEADLLLLGPKGWSQEQRGKLEAGGGGGGKQ